MSSRIPSKIAGMDSILFSIKQAFKVGPWAMLKSLLSKNSCKSCALGMGGQKGGMRDEKGFFPSVCKKAIWAQASDLQPAIPEDFFKENSIVLFLPLLFLILFIPYVFHYFFLENSVQRWYVFEQKLYRLKQLSN